MLECTISGSKTAHQDTYSSHCNPQKPVFYCKKVAFRPKTVQKKSFNQYISDSYPGQAPGADLIQASKILRPRKDVNQDGSSL